MKRLSLYTTLEAADKLGVSRQRVWQLCLVLGFHRVGRDYLLNESDLARLRARQDAWQRHLGRPETPAVLVHD